MNGKDIHEALGGISARYVAESVPKAGKRTRLLKWTGPIAAVLAAAILLGLALGRGGPLETYALAEAVYPKMAPYPQGENLPGFESRYKAWSEDQRERRSKRAAAEGLEDYYAAVLGEFLTGEDGKNRLISPLNLYFALGMLAEISGGESREEVLALLGEESVETLRARSRDLWLANYMDDGSVTDILAASLWLRDDMDYREDTLKTLRDWYYASSFAGEMGSKDYDKALQTWLDTQTGGLLSDAAERVTLDPATVIALCTTVYFKARWAQEFQAANTRPGTFHGAAGDAEADMMHQTLVSGRYIWGERFGAVKKGFKTFGGMWLILPDEGVTPEELCHDPEVLALLSLADGETWENAKSLRVNLTLPKFDVSAGQDLAEGLKNLGVTAVFDPARGDFSPLSDFAGPQWVDRVNHQVRVTADEEGVTAAAFTQLAMVGAGMPPEEEMDFTLDRPFLFAVTGENGALLFAGVVNNLT